MLNRGSKPFQSTLPVWGGTSWKRCGFFLHPSFNPPSPCGEGRFFWMQNQRICSFNPPSPCGEGLRNGGYFTALSVFQSTLPVWGGTKFSRPARAGQAFQSTLPVWGGTCKNARKTAKTGVSIHPPRVGRDSQFVSLFKGLLGVSIHPPRVGRDCANLSGCDIANGFNPPSPCGEGPISFMLDVPLGLFQSTLPVWGGTLYHHDLYLLIQVSIHPPRVGRDFSVNAETGRER